MPNASSTQAVRAVFVIDPKGIVRAIIYYPLSTGRNFDELIRLVQALQTADEFGVATPLPTGALAIRSSCHPPRLLWCRHPAHG